MLLSAEEFCDLHASELTVELRRSLLDRLGMFGVRLAVDEIAAGATTGGALAPRLVEASGLPPYRAVIAEHFLPRARASRPAPRWLRCAPWRARCGRRQRHGRLVIDREAERIEAGAVEFSRLRAAHLVASGDVAVDDGERAELARLLLSSSPTAALGLSDGAFGRGGAARGGSVRRRPVRAPGPRIPLPTLR